MLDADLADLYRVSTGQLNRAVRRNIGRFPKDFMFQLTRKEYGSLRCQIGILEKGRHSKYLPMVFTEQGVAMLSTVLRSEPAIRVNIAIMRVFVQLRQLMATHKDLAAKLIDLEGRIQKQDEKIQSVFDAMRELVGPPEQPKPPIGFRPQEEMESQGS